MTFKMSLINNIFPQQRKNPFNSSKLPEDHLSQQTKSEPSKNGKAGFFQTSKEGKYYFYGLDIFNLCYLWTKGNSQSSFNSNNFQEKVKSTDGFLILLCPLVSCLREGSRNFRNWKFMHSSLGPDTCCLTSRPWDLPQWTREFFDWRHSVTHVTTCIGGLPHADIVRVKLRLGLKEKKKLLDNVAIL